MDFADFLKTYGPVAAIVIYAAREAWKYFSDRTKSQDDRSEAQDKRDNDISASFKSIVEVFQQVAVSTANATERVADVFDRITKRMDDTAKEAATANQFAVDQRKEQTTLLKALGGAIMNPINSFGPVIEDTVNKTGKIVKDTAVDTQTTIIGEVRSELRDLKTYIHDEFKRIMDRLDHLDGLVNNAQTPSSPVTIYTAPHGTATEVITTDQPNA